MAGREKSALYPNATWEDCIDFVRTIDSFKLKVVSYTEVAKKYGLSSVTTKSCTAKISSAKQFGLITTTGGNTIQLTELCMRLLYPTGAELRSLELECFVLPPLYNKLISIYDGKAIPEEAILGNILMTDHKIARNAKDNAARCFLKSAEQLNLIQGGVLYFSESRQNDILVEKNQPLPKDKAEDEHALKADSFSNNISATTVESDYIIQNIPVKSGKVAKFVIPIDSDEDDLLLVRDMFDVILKRKFKVNPD